MIKAVSKNSNKASTSHNNVITTRVERIKDKNTHVGMFQLIMKKFTSVNVVAKVKMLDDIEEMIFVGCSAIETHILNYPHCIDEFLSYIKPETNFELRLRTLRLISSMTQTSNQLTEILKKKRVVELLSVQVIMHNTTIANMKRWAVNALLGICARETAVPVVLGLDVKVILERMAVRDWSAWGNNDAKDLIDIAVFK